MIHKVAPFNSAGITKSSDCAIKDVSNDVKENTDNNKIEPFNIINGFEAGKKDKGGP
jgi:hypothetical protein